MFPLFSSLPASLAPVQASFCHSLNKNTCSPHPSFFSVRSTSRLPAIGPPLFLRLSVSLYPQRFVISFTHWQMCRKTACPLATCPVPFVPMLITHDAPLLMPVLSLTLSLLTFLAGKSQCQLSRPRTIVLTECRASQRGLGLGLLEPGLDQMSHH